MSDVRDLLLAPDLTAEQVAALLAPYGFPSPRAIDACLQRMCPEPASRLALAEHLDAFLQAAARSADPEQCLLQLDRIAEASGQRGAVYRALGADPGWLETVCAVAGCSRALSDVLVINPEYLDILADAQALTRARTLDEMRLEASRLTGLFRSRDAALNALRRMRRREYLRIGARELTGLGSFEEVVGEISDLACALTAETLAVCHETLPFEGGERPDRFVVIAWGKLGARELNYSSDIDLALVWETPDSGEEAAQTAFYTRLAQSLVDALSRLTEEGRMYRVDLRLRPYGNAGPIGCSLRQFLNYYETWSEPWERQALIKARTIAGPPDLRERVDRFISEFTFSRPLDAVSVSSLLAVKERSEDFRGRSGAMDRQVKHGWGGIRDIEFTVQMLQLMAGASHPEARAPATLDALEGLERCGVLSPQERSALAAAYVFLRQVEHRLQLAEELPLQTLPEDPEGQRIVALRVGYRDEPGRSAREQFLEEYAHWTKTVREIHRRVFSEFESGGAGLPRELVSVLEDGPAGQDFLRGMGFRQPERAQAALRRIAGTGAGGGVSSEPQRRFLQMLPELLESLSSSADPDAALANLERMAEATGSPLGFFRSIGASRRTLDVFVRLSASSEFLTQTLQRHPEYIDMLASPGTLAAPRPLSDMEAELLRRVGAESTEEGRLNALRRFRLREFLRIGVRDVSGIARVTSTTREISLLAEACIRVALKMAVEERRAAGGLPGRIAALGMGKLGGRELHYSSDADLVFVYLEDGGTPDAFREFERCVRRVLDILGRLTEEGRGFQVDLRLRPEGGAGLLARSLEGYRRYLKESVQAWERQALVRARYVAGDRSLARALLGDVAEAVWGRPLTAPDLEELRHIKRRIENEKTNRSGEVIDLKLGPGGILDIEFTVQILQLVHGRSHPAVRRPNTLQALDALARAGALPPEEAKALREAYLFLRRAENRLQLYQDRPAEGVPASPDELGTFARRLGYPQKRPGRAAEAFLADVRRLCGRAREIHERIYFHTDLTREPGAASAG